MSTPFYWSPGPGVKCPLWRLLLAGAVLVGALVVLVRG
jgi:hypothetical protein